jgi:hypothetical protein
MTAKDFVVQKATTFDVASDGTSFRMNFICRDGGQVSLSLLAERVHGFMMTLPQLMRQALRARGHNERLRRVYPVETYASSIPPIEHCHRDSNDDGRFRSVVRSHTTTDETDFEAATGARKATAG